jgi:choline dehydrogenase-like flavoprotein
MPEIIGANTNATSVAMGEAGAEIIAKVWEHRE